MHYGYGKAEPDTLEALQETENKDSELLLPALAGAIVLRAANPTQKEGPHGEAGGA